MGYQIPILKEYVIKYNAAVHVFHWDHKKFTPYIPPSYTNITYYSRSKYKTKELVNLVSELNPDIVYISGWMDKGYLAAVRPLRKKNIPIVSGFDDIWFKTTKQRIASIFFPFVKNQFFSHAWVPGPYQYEFVKRLGFKNDEVIFNCLSADIEIFNAAYQNSIMRKKQEYPHQFLYVGRFEPIKGVDILVQAWNNIQKDKKNWELCMIGNGSLIDDIKKNPTIKVLDFMQPEELIDEIKKTGCFVLPSRKEQWALVLHEFSSSGIPIICSDTCGAMPFFMIPGYNGFTFKTLDVDDLTNQMLKLINLDDSELVEMSENSHKLGQRITPEISASCFMSILD